jgi:hypothetical protein
MRWLLLAACIVRLWLMPLGSSFWVDEMGTVFVVQQGADHPSFAAAPQVPRSIYYVLPRVSHALLGSSEIAYRVPSVLAMGVALWLIALLANRLIHPQAGWFAIFACLALRGFDYQAVDARPYALGTLLACASLYCLVRWQEWGRPPACPGAEGAGVVPGVAFVVCGALLLRVHLLFWPLYGVFAAYAIMRPRRRTIWLFVALAASLLWALPDVLLLYRQAEAHVVASLPSARDLFDSLKLGLIAVCGAGAWVCGAGLSRTQRVPRASARPDAATLALILGWWLAQPLGLFLFSWTTGNSVFVTRYLWLSLPGAALTATIAASRFLPEKQWTNAALALGVGLLILNGQWSRLWPLHHNSDWRTAARTVRELAPSIATPVICPSPFIEARPPVWSPSYPLPGFFYAHLYVYPVTGRIHLFPFESSPPAEQYATQLAAHDLSAAGRFVIYGGAGQAGYWRDWFAQRPELAGWKIRRPGPFADVEVYEFER